MRYTGHFLRLFKENIDDFQSKIYFNAVVDASNNINVCSLHYQPENTVYSDPELNNQASALGFEHSHFL